MFWGSSQTGPATADTHRVACPSGRPSGPTNRRRRSSAIGSPMRDDASPRYATPGGALPFASLLEPGVDGRPDGEASELVAKVLLHRLALSRGPRSEFVTDRFGNIPDRDLHAHARGCDPCQQSASRPR